LNVELEMNVTFPASAKCGYSITTFSQSGTSAKVENYMKSAELTDVKVSIQQATQAPTSNESPLMTYKIFSSVQFDLKSGGKATLECELTVEQRFSSTGGGCYSCTYRNLNLTNEVGVKFNYYQGYYSVEMIALPGKPHFIVTADTKFKQPTIQTMKLNVEGDEENERCKDCYIVDPIYSISIEGGLACLFIEVGDCITRGGEKYGMDGNLGWMNQLKYSSSGKLMFIIPKGTQLSGSVAYAETNGKLTILDVTCTTDVEIVGVFPVTTVNREY